MKHTLTSLLTIVIMVIGLALIIGGPGAVRFLFAPFLFGIRQAVRVVFVLLILLFFAVALLSGKRSTPNEAQAAPGTPEQYAVERGINPSSNNLEGDRNQ